MASFKGQEIGSVISNIEDLEKGKTVLLLYLAFLVYGFLIFKYVWEDVCFKKCYFLLCRLCPVYFYFIKCRCLFILALRRKCNYLGIKLHI